MLMRGLDQHCLDQRAVEVAHHRGADSRLHEPFTLNQESSTNDGPVEVGNNINAAIARSRYCPMCQGIAMRAAWRMR